MERELEDMAAEERLKREFDEADLEKTLGAMCSLKSLFVCGLVRPCPPLAVHQVTVCIAINQVESKEELMPSLEILTMGTFT